MSLIFLRGISYSAGPKFRKTLKNFDFTKSKNYKKLLDDEKIGPAVDYLERMLLATQFELHETLNRERRLRESLTSRELEIRGLALRDLKIDTTYMSPCSPRGEVEIKLVKGSHILGGKTWKTGTLVTLQYSTDPDFEDLESWQELNGMIAEVESLSLTIRFSSFTSFLLDWFSKGELDGELRLIKRSESGIYNSQITRLMGMLSDGYLKTDPCTPSGQVFNAILRKKGFNETKSSREPPEEKDHKLTLFNHKLKDDKSKMKTLSMTNSCPPLSLIHGPPGTGKTTTLAAAVLSAVMNGEKVLVTAPSHAACDAFTMALAQHWPRSLGKIFLRLGNPIRFPNKNVRKYSVDNLRQSKYLDDLQEELAFTRRQLIDQFKGKAEIIQEEERLTSEHKTTSLEVENELIDRSSVVICTLLHSEIFKKTGHFRKKSFDLFVIDEAGFTSAANILHLISRAPRLIMAGDHYQLPPVVLSQEAENLGYGVSLFETMAKSGIKNISTLETQYRSNEMISEWSSKYFYKNRVKSHKTVKDILLEDLISKKQSRSDVTPTTNPLLDTPLLFIDTAGLNWLEDAEADESVSNCEEAIFVADLVEKFNNVGVEQEDMCVITPYWSQITLIRSLLYEGSGCTGVEVRTVDGFQGREKELVIISLVRSNTNSELGFLTETRRINVSVTRAKRSCIIVGDSGTLTQDNGLTSLIQHCKQNDAYCTIAQFQNTIK